MRQAQQVERRPLCPARRCWQCLTRHLARDSLHGLPETVEEARRSKHAIVGPFLVLVGRPHKEHVHAQSIGAVAIDDRVGGDDVALRLGHLGAVLVDHPLRKEVRKRLLEADKARVEQHLRKEPAVEQMQDRVLDAADVLANR